jgi:hypothetical protein
MKYKERIICFIDILGFSKHVEKTFDIDSNDIEDEIELIANAIKSMEEYSALSFGPRPKSREVTQFSDSIVLSFDYKEKDSIFHTLLDIQLLIIDMAYKGFLCRGGIVLGKIIHSKNMVFGPGMVDAYMLESKAANYPRIILGKNILELGEFFVGDTPLFDIEKQNPTGLIGRDSDGMYYINYFSPDLLAMNKSNYSFNDFMLKLKSIIETGLDSKNQDIYVKYSWLKERYNKFVYIVKTMPEALNSEFQISTVNYDEINMIEK